MRAISRRMFNVLNSDQAQLIELMDVQLVGQAPSAAFYFTNAGEAIIWNGNTYQPINFTHGQVEERMASSSGEAPSVTVTVTNVDAQMAGLLASAEVENCRVTLRLVDRRLLSNPRDAIQLTVGEGRDFGLQDHVLTFSIVNVLGQLERINLPRRVYQPHCNFIFGEPGSCGASIPTISSTAQTGSTRKMILVTSAVTNAMLPTDPVTWAVGGYITFTDGVCGLQSRQIGNVATDPGTGLTAIYLRAPFLRDPGSGDPFKLRRMCKKTPDDCQAFQGNLTKFGGFPYVPPIQFRANQVPHWSGPTDGSAVMPH